MTLEALVAMLVDLRWPAATVHGRQVAGEAQWLDAIAVFPPLLPRERTAIARQLRRHLLCTTAVGRQRLRDWLIAQKGQPIPVETPEARRDRIARTVHYFGDPDVFWPVVTTVASLPRPVRDYVVRACLFSVTGRTTNAWTSGEFPPLLTIMLAGHRTDEEICQTTRHECAHRWLIEAREAAQTALQYETARRTLDQTYTPKLVSACIALGEQQAEWLAWAWSEK